MVKKTVKLVAQERFDIIDALALQQGTLEYVTSALGNIMGHSNGLLTDLSFDVDTATSQIQFTTKFAFFVTTADAVGNSTGGEVVIYDPSSAAQSSQALDYSSAKAAAITYFAGAGLDAEGVDAIAGPGNNLPTLGAYSPFLWARPVSVEGQLDARRKWSIAQQTETPVTINTRNITAVEFTLSASEPTVDAGSPKWAPIAKIVQWSLVAWRPMIAPISAFDNQKWANRAGVPALDTDQGAEGTQSDFYNSDNLNINTMRVMSQYTNHAAVTDRPAVPKIYDALSKIKTLLLPNAAGALDTIDRKSVV